MGAVVPLEEGRPITGEVVSLSQREEAPFLYDVRTELEAPGGEDAARRRTSGPAQVATEDYRRGWDAIWGLPASDKPY
jgi:hypothetical protein